MIYLFLADGFEEVEALCPYDLLLRAGADVKTVSIGDGLDVTGTHGVCVRADMNIADASADAEMVVLPGGMPGASNLDSSDKVDEILRRCYEKGGFVAAICAAPLVLGKRGMLSGRRATCFPGFEKYLEGAQVTGNSVETDGNVITGRGMGTAFEFGLALIRALYGNCRAREIKEKTMAD